MLETPDLLDDILNGKVTKPAQPKQQKGGFTAEEVDELIAGEHGGTVKAFFDTVKKSEGGEPDIIVGGKMRFDTNGDHPNKVGLTTAAGPSTAAGNYQITGTNWYGANGQPGLKARLGAKKFDENEQYRGAVMLANDAKVDKKGRLLRGRGEFAEAVRNGNIDRAREILAQDWTSTPGSTIGGGGQKKLSEWQKNLDENLGVQKTRTSRLDEILFGGGNQSQNLDEILASGNEQPTTNAVPEANNPDILGNLRQQKTQLEADLKNAKRVRDKRGISQAIKKLDLSIADEQKKLPAPTQNWQVPGGNQPALIGDKTSAPVINPPSPTNPNGAPLVLPKPDFQAPPNYLKNSKPKYQFEVDGKRPNGDTYLGMVNGNYRFKNADQDEYEIDGATSKVKNIGLPKRTYDSQKNEYLRADDQTNVQKGTRYTRQIDGVNTNYIVDENSIREENPKLVLGEGDEQLTESANVENVPDGYKRLQNKKGETYFAQQQKDKTGETTGKFGITKESEYGKPQPIAKKETKRTVIIPKSVKQKGGSYQSVLESNQPLKLSDGTSLKKSENQAQLNANEVRLNDEKGETFVVNKADGEVRDESLSQVAESLPIQLLPENEKVRISADDAQSLVAGQIAQKLSAKYNGVISVDNPNGSLIAPSDVQAYYKLNGITDWKSKQKIDSNRFFADSTSANDTFYLTRRDLQQIEVFSIKRREMLEDAALDLVGSGRELTPAEITELKNQDISLEDLQSNRYDDYQLAQTKAKVVKEDFKRVLGEETAKPGANLYIANLQARAKVGWLPRKVVDKEIEEYNTLRANTLAENLKKTEDAKRLPAYDEGQTSAFTSYDTELNENDRIGAEKQTENYMRRIIGLYGSVTQKIAKDKEKELNEIARKNQVAQMSWGEYLGKTALGVPASITKSAISTAISGTFRGIALAANEIDDAIYGDDGRGVKDYASYQLGEDIDKLTRKYLTVDEALEGEWLQGDLPQGIGSSFGMMIGGLSKTPRLAIAVMSSLQMGGDGYKEAIEFGATEEQAQMAGLLQSPLGVTELAGISKAVTRLNSGAGGTVWRKLFREAWREGKREAPEEMVQEGFQTVSGNVIKNVVYDPDRKADQDLAKAMLTAGFSATLVSSGVTLLNTVRNRGQIKKAIQAEERNGILIAATDETSLKILGKSVRVTPEIAPLVKTYLNSRNGIAEVQAQIEAVKEFARKKPLEQQKQVIPQLRELRNELNTLINRQVVISKSIAEKAGIPLDENKTIGETTAPNTAPEITEESEILTGQNEITDNEIEQNVTEVTQNDQLTDTSVGVSGTKFDKVPSTFDKQSANVDGNAAPELKPQATVEFPDRTTGETITGTVKKIKGKKVTVEVEGSDSPVMVKADQLTVVPLPEVVENTKTDEPQNETEKRATVENLARISDIKGTSGKAQPFEFGKVENTASANTASANTVNSNQTATRTVKVNGLEIALSPEQNERWTKEVEPLELKNKERFDAAIKSAKDAENAADGIRGKVIREEANSQARADAMQLSALKREVADVLTVKEQAKKLKREKSNYPGKAVSVEGKNATVIGAPYGNVTVEFADGTRTTVAKAKIGAPLDADGKPSNKVDNLSTSKPEKETEYRFSSTQANLKGAMREKLLALGKTLTDDADLAEDGREQQPHITVKFGLHDQKPDKIKKIIEQVAPFEVTLGKVSHFKGKKDADYDVLKVEIVDSPELHALNKLIGDNAKNTETFPVYKPHITLAYVKKGLGAKYAGSEKLAGTKISFDEIYFSDKASNQTPIKLLGNAQTEIDRDAGEKKSAAEKPQVQNARKPKKNPAEYTLSEFIRKGNGIRPSKSIDLSAIENAEIRNKKGKKKAGFAAMIRPSGSDIEDVFRNAVEAGYLTGIAGEYNQAENFDRSAFSIDEFVEAVADDMRNGNYISSESEKFSDEAIEAAQNAYYAKKAEQEKSQAGLAELSDEEFYAQKTIEDFLADDEVKQILLQSEKSGKISDKDRTELIQIGYYEKGLEKEDVENTITELEREFGARTNALETSANAQPGTDRNGAAIGDESRQDEESRIYEPENAEQIDESEPDGEVDDSFDFDDEPAPKPANQSSFDQTDLFGNKVSAKTEQVDLFDTSALESERSEAIKKETSQAYGKKTADYLFQLEKSPDAEIRRVAGGLIFNRNIVNSKGENAKALVEDAADALDLFLLAKQQKNSIREQLAQRRLDAENYSDRAVEFAKFMMAGKFAVKFDVALSEVKKSNVKKTLEEPTQNKTKLDYGTLEKPNAKNLARAFADHFKSGNGFSSIIEARKFAGNLLGGRVIGGTSAEKQIQEIIELGVVIRAQEISAEEKDVMTAFDKMVELYGYQPNLAGRTSTSILQQAYSTPAPLAYIASRLAGITKNTSVYEPTAGNGMLLMEANPNITTANELNDNRFNRLKDALPGANLTKGDALNFDSKENFDVIITNPPFGSVKDEKGIAKTFQINSQYKTFEIDHAIALKSLERMKTDGKAVLIIGSVMPRSDGSRSDAYNGKSKRAFFYSLFNDYNVTNIFTVDGGLYAKQGAGFPVDVIVIEGRGKSKLELPAATVPKVYNAWSDLKGVLDGKSSKLDADGRAVVSDAESGSVSKGDGNQLEAGTTIGQRRVLGTADGTGAESDNESGRSGLRDERDLSSTSSDESGTGTTDESRNGSRKTDSLQLKSSDTSSSSGSNQKSSGGNGTQSKSGNNNRGNGLGELDQRGNDSTGGQQLVSKQDGDAAIDAAFDALFGEETKTESPKIPAAPKLQNTVKAEKSAPKNLDEAAELLRSLLGGNETLKMARISDETETQDFDAETYEKMKPAFQAAYDHFKAKISDLQSIANELLKTLHTKYNFSREQLAKLRPYLSKFIVDAKNSALGAVVEPEENTAKTLTQSSDEYAASMSLRQKEFGKGGSQDWGQIMSNNDLLRQYNGDAAYYSLSLSLNPKNAYAIAKKSHLIHVLKGLSKNKKVSSAALAEYSELSSPEKIQAALELFAEKKLPTTENFPEQSENEQSEKAKENDLQVTYEPKSGVKSENVLVPVNMQLPISSALDALENQVGDVDEYVAGKLNLKAAEIGNYFNAEQMDALGLALFNIEGGKGFIIGDQTGLGKGRVVAGVLKYAMLNGKTPIFVTEKPNLYKDIYRDLQDIGVEEPRLLMTNSGETVYLNDEETVSIRNADSKKHAALLQEIADAGELSEHDLVVTTYNQMQTVKGARTVRHDVLEALAPNSIIVFDESHNAGGTEGSGRQSSPGLNRADFARRLARLSTGVMFSSATYAKRPEVMSLYASTDIHLAVNDISKLPDIINEGGVPLQQTVAAMLAQAGQYIRRERSFDGIEYNLRNIKVDKTVAEGISSAMRLIQSFDAIKQSALTKIDKQLKSEGKKVSGDGSTGGAGASSTNFTSIMHNLIDQMLVTTKVNETADVVIEAYRRGEKPVVTLANTMGSFIEAYADEYDLKTGDAIDLDFGNLLLRYLERSREVREKDAFNNSTKRTLSDEELGPRGVEFFNRTKDAIKAMDWSSVPVSPIDYLHNKLHEAGIRTGEVTGRSQTIDYSGDTPTYKIRPAAEIKPTGRNRTITAFNNGNIDVLILNQAGSTGLSAHANRSPKTTDRRRRHMFILQAEKNIDTHMQMLGRINRTGQIDETMPEFFSAPEGLPAVYGKPRYTQLIGDIPAEVRPAAVLAKKMASLNANTTGSKDSKVSSSEIFDFMNEYGDTVIADLMYQNPEIHAKLGEPLKYNDNGNGFEEEAAARKTTGRIPLLKISEQEEVYQRIQDAYSEYVQQLDALGENALEAKTMDLDAKTIASKEIFEKSGESPFQQSAQAETVDIKRQGKPFTKEQVLSRIAQQLEVDLTEITDSNYSDLVMQTGTTQSRAMMDEAKIDFKRYEQEILDDTPEDKLDGERAKLNGQQTTWHNRMIYLSVGAKIQIESKNFGTMHGVVLEIKRGNRTKNPLAAGDWKITFALADNLRQLTLPLSKLAYSSNFNNQISRDEAVAQGTVVFSRATSIYDNLGARTDILDAFDNAQGSTRETRTMITGNLLAGFGIAKKGQFVYYTDADGNNRQGVLMPKNFNIEKTLKDAPVLFPTIQNALDFIKAQSSNLLASTTDGVATATQSFGKFSIGVTGSKAAGGKYFLNQQILNAAGQEFAKSGSRMMLRDLDEQTAYRVMEAMTDVGDVNWQTNSYKDVANRIVGANKTGNETLKMAKSSGELSNAERREKLLSEPSVVIQTDETDRLNLFKAARALFQGKELFNADFGRRITVTKTGLKHIKAWSLDIRKAQSLLEVGKIIQEAVYLGTEASRKENENVKQYHRLATAVSINGENVIVESVVRETTNGDLLYDFDLSEIKKGFAGNSSGGSTTNRTSSQPTTKPISNLLQKLLDNNVENTNETLKKSRTPEIESAISEIEGADLSELLRVVDPVAGVSADGHLVDVKNVETFEILRRAVEAFDLEMNPNKKDRSRFDGLFLDPAELSGVIKILRRGADFGSRDSGLEISDRRKLHTIADTLKTAAKIDGTVIVKIFDDAIPHEETHHISFVEAADKHLEARHGKNLNNLFQHEMVKKLLSGAFSRLLPKRAGKAYIVEEANAWLLGSLPELNKIQRQMNLPEITKDEAADFCADWQISYHQANPNADMKKFAAISEFAQEIYEQSQRIQETTRNSGENNGKNSDTNAAGQSGDQSTNSRTDGKDGSKKSSAVAGKSEEITTGETAPGNSAKSDIPEFVPSGDEKVSNTPLTARGASIPLADRIYTSVTNDAQTAYADDVLDKGIGKATDWFNEAVSLNDHHHGATTAIGLNLMQQYGQAGDLSAMNKVADALVPYLTEAGQAIQAVAILSMHNPKLAGAYAAKVKKQKTGKDITADEYDKAIAIAEQLSERAKIDGAAKAALEQAQIKLNDLEAEQKELERAAKIAGNKNEKLNLKLADARKEIASAKAKIKRLEEMRPAKTRAVAHGKLLSDLKSRENEILANLRAKFGGQETLKMAQPANSSAAPSDDVLDWATLTLLQNLPTGAMSVGEFKNALNQITGGQLSVEEINDIHAAAIERIKQSKPPADDAKKAVAKNRSEHYAEAKKHENRFEKEFEKIVKDAAKQLKKDEKDNKTDAFTTALITVWANGEFTDADIFLALARKTKLSDAEIAELKKQGLSDDKIAELNQTKLPSEVIGLLKQEFPDITPEEIRRAITASDEITQLAKDKIESDRILKENEYDLTSDAVERIKEEKRFNQKQTQKIANQAARFYAGLAQTNTQIAMEAIVSLRRAGLLTGIKTHVRNFASNTLFEISEEMARPIQALADIIANAFTGAGRTAQGISPAGIKNGFKNIFKEDETLKNLDRESGLKTAYSIMVNGDTAEHMAKLQLTESHLEDKIGKIGAIADGYINFVFRTMGAEDALFKIYAFRRSLEEQAHVRAKSEAKNNPKIDVKIRRKELITNPTNVMEMEALDFADEMTFQNENKISNLVNKIRNYNTATKTTLGIIAPFDRTPTNVLLRVLEHTPLGFVKAANDVRNLRNPKFERVRAFNNKYRAPVQKDLAMDDDFNQKSATEKREIVDEALKTLFTREQQRAFAKTFGRATIGSAGITLGFLLAMAGLLAGVMEPDDDDKEETNEFFARRKAGIENRSLRIPGIGRFVLPDDPWMRSLTLGATIYEQAALAEKKKQDIFMSTVGGLSESFAEIALDQPLIDSSISYYKKLKKGKFGELAGSIAGSFVPTIIADVGDVLDEKARTGSSYVPGEKINTTGDWLRKQGRGFANSSIRRVPILRNYFGAEDTGSVSPEERGGVLRRLVRMVDSLNTRSDIEYTPGTLSKTAAKKTAKNDLIESVDTGKISAADAKKEIKEKVKSSELTTKQGAAMQKTISLTPIERTAFNLDAADETDFVKIEEFSKTVKPEDKEKIYKILWNKYQNKMDGTPDAATLKQARRLKEIVETNFAAERKAAIEKATRR